MRALLALPLLLLLVLAACDRKVTYADPVRLAPSVVCAAVDERYERCRPAGEKDIFTAADVPICEQQVASGGQRDYWECVAQLSCTNNPGSCESLRP